MKCTATEPSPTAEATPEPAPPPEPFRLDPPEPGPRTLFPPCLATPGGTSDASGQLPGPLRLTLQQR